MSRINITMTEIDIIRQQRDILFNACKSVATDKKCPDWISKVLSTAAMNVKKIQETEKVETDIELSKALELNAYVKSNKPGDYCIYQIQKIGPEVQGVQLYDVVIVKGNATNPVGSIIYNVPSTMLVTAS